MFQDVSKLAQILTPFGKVGVVNSKTAERTGAKNANFDFDPKLSFALLAWLNSAIFSENKATN